MSHPLVLALFSARDGAVAAGRALQALGIGPRSISVVARSHEEEGALAHNIGGTPGVELEDSATAARIGEFSGVVLAAVALVMPGIGNVVTAGPLSAELGETAGHLAGGLPEILERSGVAATTADRWQERVQDGAVLLGVHAVDDVTERVVQTLRLAGADEVEEASWQGELP